MSNQLAENKSDFSQGSISKTILKLAAPLTVAQFVNVLYNVVDRMYIGRIPEIGRTALTGLGICFPIITLITAFTALCGQGGAPLFSISRGRGDNEDARRTMGNAFSLLLIFAFVLTVVFLIIKRPVLLLFGASTDTLPYANKYLTIYLIGTVFVMISVGMNLFISAQGFGRTAMMTTVLGAVINILLDPLFIFVFNMGVRGAALATIIAQFFSAVWVIKFLTGKKAIIKISLKYMRLESKRVFRILSLGTSAFIMSVTNSLVQIVCNSTLKHWGGDLYVGVMTIVTSLHEVIQMPIIGCTRAAEPVLSYNYGANENQRVKQGIKFVTIICVCYSIAICILILLLPKFFVYIFNDDPQLITHASPAIRMYFSCYFAMSLQMAGQTAFVALGKSRQAIFFSLLRKAIIVVPLTILLPGLFGMGTYGVFWAEPISCVLGGSACYITMYFTIWSKLKSPELKASGN